MKENVKTLFIIEWQNERKGYQIKSFNMIPRNINKLKQKCQNLAQNKENSDIRLSCPAQPGEIDWKKYSKEKEEKKQIIKMADKMIANIKSLEKPNKTQLEELHKWEDIKKQYSK